jgi:hypothetical protein
VTRCQPSKNRITSSCIGLLLTLLRESGAILSGMGDYSNPTLSLAATPILSYRPADWWARVALF